MRIAVSGPHGTGKTTLAEELCEHLPNHTLVDEPYYLLEEEGYTFAHPPSIDDYWAQLARSVKLLCTPDPRVVFDRSPLDFLAYLAALGADVSVATNDPVLHSTLASLDILVVVPITKETERALPTPQLRTVRSAMNTALLDLIYDDPLDIRRDVRTVELHGPLERRVAEVLAALPQ